MYGQFCMWPWQWFFCHASTQSHYLGPFRKLILYFIFRILIHQLMVSFFSTTMCIRKYTGRRVSFLENSRMWFCLTFKCKISTKGIILQLHGTTVCIIFLKNRVLWRNTCKHQSKHWIKWPSQTAQFYISH